MELAGAGLRLASSAFTPLIKRLFRQDGPGAGLVDKPVRVSALVSFTGEKRTLTERDLTKLARTLVERAVEAAGPDGRLLEDEQAAVADLLARTLMGFGDLDIQDVQAVQLGAQSLANLLYRPSLVREYQLPRDVQWQFRALLRTTCLHILNFFTQRSTFIARTLVEQSRQLDRLVRTTDLLLERIPHQSVEDASFEKRYADYIEQEHCRLTIYGLDLQQAREWPLDDAYLSLETHRSPGETHRSSSEETAPQRAERALAGLSRVLLRGLAGSGKTTLVQWLAVSTARDDPGDGLTHLVGRVPFVLPLRTLTRDQRRLPDPEAFLSVVDCPLASAQPDRWADRVLSARRGLLLVDGIDEIPEGERENIRRSLRRLDAAYPGNLWLVTARPSAVGQDWLRAEQFTELSLAPMRHADVQAFIHRWHHAVGESPSEANALLDLVRARADLGSLASNPLMCALICALHRKRNGYLPRGREELRCLSTLRDLRRVSLRGDVTADQIIRALGDSPLRLLYLSNPRIRDIGFIRGLATLETLYLTDCPNIADVSALADTTVSELLLYSDPEPWCPRGLDALKALTTLAVGSRVTLESLTGLPQQAPLTSLTLPMELPGLADIGTWPGLERLALHFSLRPLSPDEWRTVAELPELKSMVLNSDTISTLAGSGITLPRVKWIQLFPRHRERPHPREEIEILTETFPGLTSLVLNSTTADFSPLGRLPALRKLTVQDLVPDGSIPEHIETVHTPTPARY